MGKCLGCHHKIEDIYNFCSYTCAALCGYFDVKKGWIKSPANLSKKDKDEFLNNDPVRVYDKEKYL